MRVELAEIEQCCQGILEETADVLTWDWDGYIDAMLAVFQLDQTEAVGPVLDKYFTSRWDEDSVPKAPQSVQEIAEAAGGIRRTQHLFTTRPEQSVMAYGAWWPWGDGETLSIRIGLVLKGVSDYDADVFHREFREMFLGEE